MKTLHIFNELMPSGAEVMMISAAPYWREAGIDSSVLSTGDVVGPYSVELAKAGYNVFHIPFKKSPLFFLSVLRLVASKKIDVIHIHCERAAFYYAICAFVLRKKTVRTIHSTFAFTGLLAVRRRLQRRILNMLKCRQVSISHSVKETEKRFLCNDTILIPNWFDDKKYRMPDSQERQLARSFYGIPENSFVVVSVGNCAPVKNHGAVLRALAILRDSLDFIYLHVGREEEGHPERKLAFDLGIEARVRFVGLSNDVVSALFAADVFVMPSLYEGLGLAALEAMATGVPAVLSDVRGLDDLKMIKGVSWSDLTPATIADRILQTSTLSGKERSALSISLSKQTKAIYDVRRSLHAYIDLYNA